MGILRAFVRDHSGSACLRTALAIGATALLPALGWEAGDGSQMTAAAMAPQPGPVQPAAMVTIVGKQGVTWTHAKSDRAPSPSPVQVAGQPETVTELIDLAGASPETDGNLPEGLEEGSADPAVRDAARAEFSGWLSFNETSGSLRITGFDTLREPIGRKACRARHDEIVQAFDVDQSRARVLADQPVMFQSRICAANGEIVITCQGSDAVISPRRARPDSACSRS
jgi:hypothetical protein